MAIIIRSETSASVRNPPSGKVSLFHDSDTNYFSFKKPNGNITKINNLNSEHILTLDDINSTNTNLNVGSVYLYSGSMSISSSAYFGTISGLDTAIVTLYRDSTNTTVVTWSQTGSLANVLLTNSASVPSADWYSIRVKTLNGGDSVIIKGMRLIF